MPGRGDARLRRRATSSCARSSRCGSCAASRNGPSPDWLQRRLTAIGLRPINALVDITNYITFDRGRPLHVFDAAQGEGQPHGPPRPATARRCWPSTAAPTGSTTAIVVIADEAGVESIAGIMGGEHSGCDEGTTDVLIESALWDPLNIAQTGPQARHHHGCALPLRARRRPALLPCPASTSPPAWSSTCAAARRPKRPSPAASPEDSRVIDFPWTEVKRLSGLDVPRPESKVDPRAARLPRRRQRATGSRSRRRPGGRTSRARPISSRRSSASPASTASRRSRCRASRRRSRSPILTAIQKRTRLAKRTLAARGLVEAVTWSFIAQGGGGAVRRRRQAARARQPDRVRSLRHAPEPAAGPAQGRAAQRRPRLRRRRPVRGRPDASPRTSRRGRRSRRPRSAAARRGRRASAATGTAAPSRSTPSTPRRTRWRS